MFRTFLFDLLSDESVTGFRYAVIASSVLPLIGIFVYSSVINKKNGGKGWIRESSDTSATPPKWVFAVVWSVLTILWALVLINSAMEMNKDSLTALFIFHLIATTLAMLWIWATDLWPKRGPGSWLMAGLFLTALMMYSVLIGSVWVGGDLNSGWQTATMWTPMLAWIGFATILSIVDSKKIGSLGEIGQDHIR